MTNRLICVSLFVLAVAASILGGTSILDPLYSFLSASPLAVAIRLAIVISLLAVSFIPRVLQPPLRAVISRFSVFLVLFGITSLFSNSMGYMLYTYVMPLDSIIMIEAGVLFGLVLLTSSPREEKA